jgi:hypothetical protein
MTRFIVMTRSAGMPSGTWGRYRRVAVVETDLPEGMEPVMISPRSKGVVRIVQTWERCSAPPDGKNTQYTRALAEAEELVEALNRDRAVGKVLEEMTP